MSAKVVTRIAIKLHLFHKREIVNQTRERKMLVTINFHKRIKRSLKHQVRKI